MKITQELLQKLIDKNLSIREIGQKVGLSQTAVRYWLNKFKLKTCSNWFIENQYKYSDDKLLEIWNNSDSLNQFLLNLGVGTGGGAYYHYKNRLINLGVDFKKFMIDAQSRGGFKTAILRNKKSIKKRIRLPRPTLKKSMDLASVPYKCSKCQLVEWLGKKLKLHIHHKDEDRTNNKIENLEYLCPNCHSIEHYTEI